MLYVITLCIITLKQYFHFTATKVVWMVVELHLLV
jgi:hypothetical protein